MTFPTSIPQQPLYYTAGQRAEEMRLRTRWDIMINCLLENSRAAQPTSTSSSPLSRTFEEGGNYLSALSLRRIHLIVSQRKSRSARGGGGDGGGEIKPVGNRNLRDSALIRLPDARTSSTPAVRTVSSRGRQICFKSLLRS